MRWMPSPLVSRVLLFLCLPLGTLEAAAAPVIASPEDYFGHRIGADGKLVSWSGIVDYLRGVEEASDRVHVREIGPTTEGRPFLLVEISSQSTMADLEAYKRLQRQLYFQDHHPGQDPAAVHSREQEKEILERGKAVVLITCTVHSTEVGAAQMSLELVHRLATENTPRVRKILDNVIFLLVPSLNPDGQAMVADWYNSHLGGEFEAGPLPWLYHPYVGHDNNRDVYMFTQIETRLIGQVLYKDWFPSIWLDEHQMGYTGPRIFTMPATDPININVHPLIYRLNGLYGQAQAAGLEAAGKVGIIYDYTYTNYWEGAMAWAGWWHNQVGMLTEVASARLATPTEQRLAKLGTLPSGPRPSFRRAFRRMMEHPDEPLAPPRDVQPRTAYPRPWLGGKWSLRDIVDYELVASLALLEAAADTRRQLQQQIYEINRSTIAQFLEGQKRGRAEEVRKKGGYGEVPEALQSEQRETGRLMPGFVGSPDTPYAILAPTRQHDPPEVSKMLQALEAGGVVVERARGDFVAAEKSYPAGTYVIRLAQVFGRYAKDMLEDQSYPEVRLAPSLPPQPPYDVTAWSLGKQMGVETRFIDEPFEAALEVVSGVPLPRGRLEGTGNTFLIDAVYNDGFKLVNQLLKNDAHIRRTVVGFDASDHHFVPGTWVVQGPAQEEVESLAGKTGLTVYASPRVPDVEMVTTAQPRIALYQPWGSNMDEGWTRWLLEEYGFDYTTLHPQDLRAAGPEGAARLDDLRIPAKARAEWPPHVAARAPREVVAAPLGNRFDVLLFTHQNAEEIVKGNDFPVIPPVYRGGIGEEGLAAVKEFVKAGGTVVALGNATSLLIKDWPIPVRNIVAKVKSEEFLIPGSILKIQSDPDHPLAWGMPPTSYGYFIRSPVFTLSDGFRSQRASVAVRYPNQDLKASGWTHGEELIAGHAAAVQVDFAEGGRLILLGLRPQHRAQTHATFKLLFNALTNPG
ncbi:MAG: M14 metallopeptidase family protein [Acidobacteriota bacterium]